MSGNSGSKPPRPRDPRARALDVRREGLASALVAAAGLVPFGIGALFGVLPREVPLEPRASWVIALASILALGSWCVQRERDGAARFAPLSLLVAPAFHLASSGSAFWASFDALVFVGATTLVALRAPVRFLVRHHASNVSRRFFAFAVLLAVVPGPLFTVDFGLLMSVVIPAVTRLLHPAPERVLAERAADFTTEDGLTLRATYWPGLPDGPAVVIVHGLHDGRDMVLDWARALNERGAHVLAYDQRGHAASEGALITFADREPGDVVRATERLIELAHASPDEVGLLGISMGGGAVLRALPALTRRGLRRVVLFAPASDYDVLVTGTLPPPPFLAPARGIVFAVSHALGYRAPLELVPRIALDDAAGAEVLVLHGTGDRTIPPALTERIANEHPEVTVRWIDDLGHDEIPGFVLADRELSAATYAWLGLDDR